MARARKSHIGDEEKVKTAGLLPARGKVGDNPYVIYASLQRDGMAYPRILVLGFAAKYAAHYCLMKLIKGDSWEECIAPGGRIGINTGSDICISMNSNVIWELIDYEPTELEATWQDDQIDKFISAFKYGRDDSDRETQEITPGDPKPKAEPKPKREKIVKEVKAKLNLDGYVSANDIALKLKVEGREVRGILRGLSLEKPEHGWSWPKTKAAEIEKLVVDQMRKEMAQRSKKAGKK